MTDSLIVARALLRLGPFARVASAESCSRSIADVLEERRRRRVHPRGKPSQDPWRTGAARAAFAIWATDASRADAPVVNESDLERHPTSQVRR